MSEVVAARELIKEMNRYYEARAPWHDRYMGFESIEIMEELLSPLIGPLEKIVAGKSVLEIACGTGNWTLVLAKRAREIMAIDISPAALEIAKTKLRAYGNVDFRSADAYDLVGVAEDYEVVFAADWWSHIPKRMIPTFLDSIRRKSDRRATLILIDMSITEHFRQEPSYGDCDGNRVSLRTLPDGSEYRVVKNFPSEEELKADLEPYGREVYFREFDALKRWAAVFELCC